ncbi:hypothetical protein AB0I37_24890 [Micromonospora purpureochromogenes]|uniref:hypothetical protein n=1 Tax=Micromonospora purpureochromogenes TaxID=47872 RepID=UPI00340825C0
MARLLGPDAGSRYAYLASGAPAASVPAVVYSDAAGTIPADIRAYDGSETPGGTILGSQVTTDADGQLERFWFPDGLVDRVWVSVNGGPVFPADADNNRRLDMTRRVFVADAYGAVGDDATDSAAGIQAAIDAAAAAGGGEVRLGQGIYRCGSTIVLPVNTPIALRGEGRAHVGGAISTSLRRAPGFHGLLLDGLGTGVNGHERIHVEISDMEIHGGGATTTVVRLSKISTSVIHNVRFTGSTGTLLHATEWWNCWMSQSVFNGGGTGSGTPASVFDGDCNTVHVTACEWEGNGGTDVSVAGLALLFTGCKWERDTGSFPLIALGAAGAVQITGGFLHLGPSATGAHVVQSGSVVPSRPNGITNTEISGNKNVAGSPGGDALVPYFVDVTAGSMLLDNVSMNGNPTTAFVHVGSALALDAVRARNITVTDPAKLWHDERAGSLYAYGSVPLVPAISTIAATNSVNRPVWILPDAATNSITYASVPVPADAAPGRPVRVRFLWYSDVAAGNVRYTVGVRALTTSGDDITVGQTDSTATVAVPGTANRTTTTTVTSAVTVQPGTRFLAVQLSRIGADAADTAAGGFRILGAEVLYERAV